MAGPTAEAEVVVLVLDDLALYLRLLLLISAVEVWEVWRNDSWFSLVLVLVAGDSERSRKLLSADWLPCPAGSLTASLTESVFLTIGECMMLLWTPFNLNKALLSYRLLVLVSPSVVKIPSTAVMARNRLSSSHINVNPSPRCC